MPSITKNPPKIPLIILILLAILLIVLLACAHTASYQIENALNTYYANLQDYQTICQAPTSAPEPGCQNLKTALEEFLKADRDAAIANTRGGTLPTQLQILADKEAATQTALKVVKP